MQRSTYTPWGPSESQTPHGEIVFHSTASHGGFHVPAHLLATMPPAVLHATYNSLGLTGWFEEDVDANYVVSFFRDLFPRADVLRATENLRLDLSWAKRNAEEHGGAAYKSRYRAKVAALNALRMAQGATVPKGWESADTTLYA